jgi:hypothetical protein
MSKVRKTVSPSGDSYSIIIKIPTAFYRISLSYTAAPTPPARNARAAEFTFITVPQLSEM